MQIQLDTLTLRNFMSYGNNETVINLQNPGTTLIIGEDLDNTNEGKSGNGVGKSSIINGLAYALYDKPISNISKDNLVNNINKKNMIVTLEFTIGPVKYRVVRERKTKVGAAGNNVYFYIDGVDKTRSSAETNKDIEAIIGIPHELFSRIIVFSASHQPFLDLPSTSTSGPNQKDIIEELFGLTALSKKAALLKEHMRDTKSSLDTKRMVVKTLEDECARREVQIENAKRRVVQWEQSTATEQSTLQESLDRVEKINVEEQKNLHQRRSALSSDIRAVKQARTKLISDSTSLSSAIATAQHQLAHLAQSTCPFCKQDYTDTDGSIEECNAVISSNQGKLTDIQAELTKVNTELDAKLPELDQIENSITVSDLDELIRITSQRDIIAQRILDLSTVAVNPYLDPLEELENTPLDNINYDDINSYTQLLEHQDFLLKLLTKKDSFVRKVLLDKNIPYLNSQLRIYLTALGLPHSVLFTHEMTASISRFGTPLDFGNLSAGQRARVNIALSFAFRNVLQNIHSTINVCMLDEIFDIGLDAVGVQLTAKLVKMKTREEGLSMYIISHREEVSTMFDRIMNIEYSKGFSYIIDKTLVASV